MKTFFGLLLRNLKKAGPDWSTEASRKKCALAEAKFQEVQKVLQEDGFPQAWERLRAFKLRVHDQANTLMAMAKNIYPVAPQAAIDAAWEAQAVDPKPHRAKWLAFRLYEQGFLDEPAALLARLPDHCQLSPSEQRRANEILSKNKRNLQKKTENGDRQVLAANAPKILAPRLMVDQELLLAREKRKKIWRAGEIWSLRRRFHNLGIRQRSKRGFEELAACSPDHELRRMAAWELAQIHLNDKGDGYREKALEYLSAVKSVELDPDMTARVAILEAEAMAAMGREADAAAALSHAMEVAPMPDLFLARANLEREIPAKVDWINRCLLAHSLAPISIGGDANALLYDRLECTVSSAVGAGDGAPLVTVIVPAFEAEKSIATTLRSLLTQTYKNIEIIVSDDCSKDRTREVVREFSSVDGRVKLIGAEENAGPYVARNLALRLARGEFVTCNDADDWSHPEKIERQVQHLLLNTQAVATTSQQARLSNELLFSRRGNAGIYTQKNMSSLMFRREAVVTKMGFWDSVRFGGDSEYLKRMKVVFGEASVIDLPSGTVSFQRHTGNSLTASASFGYHGYKLGARLAYDDLSKHFYSSAERIYVDFPSKERAFPVPRPMLTDAVRPGTRSNHFDIILASDFRFPGGTSMSNFEELRASKELGLQCGLVQMSVYDLGPERPLHPKIASVIDGKSIHYLVYGETVSCDLLIIRHPWVLQELQEFVPTVRARDIRVIVNQPPRRAYGEDGEDMFHLGRCAANLGAFFEGSQPVWHPIGPLVRQALVEHHQDDLAFLKLSDSDWTNIIKVEEWRRPMPARPGGLPVRICRHSRDSRAKWPDDAESMLRIYPNSANYEIHVLGGAESARSVLGELPQNWHVSEFGAVDPREFLANCDVFVYYTHSSWVESFGRVILEAMAVGLPVFLPPAYEPLFGEAAIYADPEEVTAKITLIVNDESAYQRQVEKAWSIVERNFGYRAHAGRVRKILGAEGRHDSPLQSCGSQEGSNGYRI